MRCVKTLVCLTAVAGLLLTGTAEAMNKAELIEAIAKESKLSMVNAENVLNAFMNAVAAVLSKGERIALAGFGSFSVSKRAAHAYGCGTEVEVEFVAGSSFVHGEKPLDAGGDQEYVYPFYVESSQAQEDGTIVVFGWTRGAFGKDDEVLVLEEVQGGGVVYQDIVARGLVAAVIVQLADGSDAPVDFGEGDEVVGLILRGIEKKDIRRGMVIAKPGAQETCPEEGAIVRDEEFLWLMTKEVQLEPDVLVAAYNAILDIITRVVNSGEEVDIEEFGSFYEEYVSHVSAHEVSHVVQQRKGRNPQTGKEIKIVAKRTPGGFNDREFERLVALVAAAMRRGGNDIKSNTEKKVRFKAGAELAEKVRKQQ